MFVPGALSRAVWNKIVKKTSGKSNHKAVGKELFNIEFDGGIAYIFKSVSIVCGCIYSVLVIFLLPMYLTKVYTLQETLFLLGMVVSQIPFFVYTKKIQRTYYIFTENELIYCEGGKEKKISYVKLKEITKKKNIKVFTKYIIPLEHGKIKINRRYCDLIDCAMKYIHNLYSIPMPIVSKKVEKKVCRYYHAKLVTILSLGFAIVGAVLVDIAHGYGKEDRFSEVFTIVCLVICFISIIISIIIRIRNTPKVEQPPKF